MVRKYNVSDWSEVCRVFDASKPRELASAGVETSFVPLADDEARRASFARSTIFVWPEEGTLRGFIGFERNYLGWLFVDPVAYRRGIARALLREVLPRIESAPWLWAMKENTPAIALYRSEGFEIVEETETQNEGLPCVAVKLSRRNDLSSKASDPAALVVTPPVIKDGSQ